MRRGTVGGQLPMDEDTRPALDSEAPVNPYSLLEAVNRASRSTGRAWLAFVALASYLALVLAGITPQHLLLNADVRLPILQLDVGLTRFFAVAPFVLLAAHIALLGQMVLLARKALAFDTAVRLLESTDERSHPLRLELDNFFLVQALAGPRRSRVVSAYPERFGLADGDRTADPASAVSAGCVPSLPRRATHPAASGCADRRSGGAGALWCFPPEPRREILLGIRARGRAQSRQSCTRHHCARGGCFPLASLWPRFRMDATATRLFAANGRFAVWHIPAQHRRQPTRRCWQGRSLFPAGRR